MNHEPIGSYPSPSTVWRAILLYLIAVVLCCTFAVTSCFASPTLEEVATSPETFAVCKTADILSTIYILAHGGVENNPIVAWSVHVGGYAPLILVSGAVYWWMKTHEEARLAIAAVNAVTCGVAVHNLTQIP